MNQKTAFLKLAPSFHDNIWGGRRLIDEYGMKCSLDRAAEAWTLSSYPGSESIVAGGEFDGLTLPQAIDRLPGCPLGTNSKKYPFFPLLIKLIDARQDLSIQVHPDDAYAAAHENGFGKTEMWYIVDCDPGARLLFGFEKEISKEEFARRIRENTLTQVLHSAPVKKGDCFFIPSGTIHAIGAGILIAEIQQNSNSTYRVYDYGRVGTNGKPRELHIEKALDVTKRIPAAPPSGLPENVLADCAYFKVIRIPAGCSSSVQITDASFCAVLCTAGTGSFTCCGQTASCKAGDCCFIPAGSGELSFAGNAEFLLSFVK